LTVYSADRGKNRLPQSLCRIFAPLRLGGFALNLCPFASFAAKNINKALDIYQQMCHRPLHEKNTVGQKSGPAAIRRGGGRKRQPQLYR
jgi:hypothetical protein